MPSFWLNDEWDWMLLTKNLSNITTEIYTGEFQDFLTRLIYGCLSMHGKDPENFITENINKKALNKRLKEKGIHNACHIVVDQIPQQN